MKILGIDPNAETGAFALYDTDERRVIEHGQPPIEGFIGALALGVQCADADAVVIERLQSFGLRVGQPTFDAQWNAGRCYEAAPLGRRHWLSRKETRRVLLGGIIGNDADVRAKLIDMHGPTRREAFGLKKSPGPLFGLVKDRIQAGAVAIAWAIREGYMECE